MKQYSDDPVRLPFHKLRESLFSLNLVDFILGHIFLRWVKTEI